MIIWAIALLIMLSIVIDTIRYGISPMPSPRSCHSVLRDYLPDVSDGKVYDLGSGWGGVLRVLKTRYPANEIIGIEGSMIPALISRLCLRNVKVKRENFFDQTFQDACFVYCYLYPKAMERLSKKLKQELPKGTYLISAVFAMPGWEPVKVYQSKDLFRSKLYIYQT